ncbi:probable chitinase 10 [Ornithodoros turicata]|uniref:probable chitinase 10 n=1 Tax=Ornithodoros turicata TaxID=34597 RepID=UPI003138EAC7
MLGETAANVDPGGPDPNPLCSTVVGCAIFILVMVGWSVFTILEVDRWDTDHPETVSSSERTYRTWTTTAKPHRIHTQRVVQKDDAYGGGNFALFPPEYYLNNSHKYYCFYHSSLERVQVLGTTYGLNVFPYHLCTHAVFCCTRVHPRTHEVEADDEAGKFSPLLKTRNPYIKTLAGISGRASSNVLEKTWTFIDKLVQWLFEKKYDGVVLMWAHPLKSLQLRAKYRELIDGLSRRFAREKLTFSMVIDAIGSATLDVGELDRLLLNYSMLLYPIAPEPPLVQSDGIEERSAVLYERGRLTTVLKNVREHVERYHPNVSSNYKVCYILSFAGTSYKFWNRNQTGIEEIKYGPGDPGPFTKTPGTLAYYEICNEVWENSKVFEYGEVALRADTWVSHLSEFVVPALARHIHDVLDGRCFGAWNLYFDDFAGECGRGPYPLMRKLFGLFEDRR